MLVSLSVQNFAIINNIQVDFKNNMTVLTGETGAGKSLIIDAIGLLFGKRAYSDMVRHNENKAVIEGCFSEYNDKIIEVLNKYDIPFDLEELLVIKREIYSSGKSICKINNNTVSLSNLIEISEHIGDIHSQFDTQGLVNPKNYLTFLDNQEILNELNLYKKSLQEYNQVNNKYKELLNKSKEDNSKIDYLKYQLTEIEKAKLNETEEEELKIKINYLSNFENISLNIKEIIETYEEKGLLDEMYNSITNLQKISKYDELYNNIKEKVEEYYYGLTDLIMELKNNFKNFDYDPNELDNLNLRLSIYSDLKRKYKMSIKEIIEYYKEIKNKIEMMENYDTIILDLEKNTKKLFNETYRIAKNISEKRKQIAIEFENKIKETLYELQLKNTNFKIQFDESDTDFKNDGIDKIDFLISFNKGEPLKPLSKVASGGELSRFMLSLKTLVSEKMNIQTIVFDEIDSGVSGSIAYSIANKIKVIALNTQVLCVTHLPQVAAISNNHIKISKSVDDNNRTNTYIKELDYENRIIEIAKMISNGEITEASKNLAIELLK